MAIRDALQDSRLDQLAEEARAADDATIGAVSSLGAQIAALRQEVLRQGVALGVLTQALVEQGFDSAVLKARFEQAMAQAQAQAQLFACPRCRKQVDRSKTQVTENGVVCDACYQREMSEP
ncbi:MAG: hypothetical protein HY908_35535 [Myxococcales bacterium]|nr:hypothetical protein [Myxococcales bacterium]